ncbi:gluconokinase [Glycomyces xiaoerkulensis]|uniref:gluconokinase n=1 Tax=Glycomyces xiaoerkulensis TaxID=2038139 RepID=UPI000C25817F|nr:gluconokinase [Glycomyces xiaoerkulensis]
MTMCLVVMGVSGSGKTTVAEGLASRLAWPVAEGDRFHPAANIAKMESGLPLDDEDRAPWLRSIRDWIGERAAAGQNAVVTCSALKRSYRDLLRGVDASVRFVHLSGAGAVIAERLGARSGHFMPPRLLDSQFGDLEPLESGEAGITADVGAEPEEIIAHVLERLGLQGRAAT